MRNGQAFGGGILRDHEGKMVFAFHKVLGAAEVLTAECLSLVHGLQLCRERNLEAFQVEVDSQALVQLIQSNAVAVWPLSNILRRARQLMTLAEVHVEHICREANAVADRLAALDLSSDTIFLSEGELPPTVRAPMQLDSRQVPSFRSFSVRE